MIGVAASTVGFAILAVSGQITQGWIMPYIYGMVGMGSFAGNLLRLPRWRREREQQMAEIAAKVKSITGSKDQLP